MEHQPASDQTIASWLRDYTHFICDQLRLPHDQGEGLLQQYLHLTVGGSPPQQQQQPASSLEQGPPIVNPNTPPTACLSYPPLPEQSPSAPLAEGQDFPPSHAGPSNWHHEPPSMWEETNGASSNPTAMTAPIAAVWEPFTAYDHQQPDPTASDLNLPTETASPLMQQSSAPYSQIPIGTVADYDPLWVQRNNYDPALVETYQSRMKYDTLTNNGVLKHGDVLTFQVSVPAANGEYVKTEAHLTMIAVPNRRRCNPKFPDLTVTLLSDPSRQYPLAKACTGTNSIISHLENACNMIVISSNWHEIQVCRGEQALGSLWWVRSAFHLWRDWKDQEAQETGERFRTRRPEKVKGRLNGVVCHNGRLGVWVDGVFVPDPDQARYRPHG